MRLFVPMMMRALIISFLILLISGCSLFQRNKEKAAGDPNVGTPSAPQRANFSPVDSSYASGQLQEALKTLEPILKIGHRSPDYPLAVFRAARIHEALGNWSSAVALYRNLLAISLRSDAGTRAEVLRRIALCHEGAGDHRRALLAWLDLSKNPSLPLTVKTLEVPLRIASLYYKLGHLKESEKFFLSVEKSLKKDLSPQRMNPETPSDMVADMGKRKSEVLLSISRTLGLKASLQDLESPSPSLFRSQDYLVQTILTPQSPAIDEASGELEKSFAATMDVMNGIPLPENEDPVVAQTDQLERKKNLAAKIHQRLMIVLNQLSPKLKIYETLWAFDQKIGIQLYERSPVERLTPESQEREGLFRKGVVIDPKGLLEKPAQKSKESTEKK